MELTLKQARALEALKESGDRMFADDIAALYPEVFEKGGKSVNPIMINLCAKGFVAKQKATRAAVSKDGNPIEKELTAYFITDEGANLEYTIKEAK